MIFERGKAFTNQCTNKFVGHSLGGSVVLEQPDIVGEAFTEPRVDRSARVVELKHPSWMLFDVCTDRFCPSITDPAFQVENKARWLGRHSETIRHALPLEAPPVVGAIEALQAPEAQQVFRLERKHVSDCRLCIKICFYLTVVLRTRIRPKNVT